MIQPSAIEQAIGILDDTSIAPGERIARSRGLLIQALRGPLTEEEIVASPYVQQLIEQAVDPETVLHEIDVTTGKKVGQPLRRKDLV